MRRMSCFAATGYIGGVLLGINKHKTIRRLAQARRIANGHFSALTSHAARHKAAGTTALMSTRIQQTRESTDRHSGSHGIMIDMRLPVGHLPLFCEHVTRQWSFKRVQGVTYTAFLVCCFFLESAAVSRPQQQPIPLDRSPPRSPVRRPEGKGPATQVLALDLPWLSFLHVQDLPSLCSNGLLLGTMRAHSVSQPISQCPAESCTEASL